jgi:hypothetical protein
VSTWCTLRTAAGLARMTEHRLHCGAPLAKRTGAASTRFRTNDKSSPCNV